MVRLEKELNDFMDIAKYQSCILLINDGSLDGSRELIYEICSRNANFFYLDLQSNGGLSTAMKAGVDHVYSKYVGYMDADLQTSPQDFNLLLDYIEDYEMVVGIRTGRKDSFTKKISSKVANGFRRYMTGDDIEDTGCPLKVLHTDYAKRIPFFTGMHRFLPALIQLQNGHVMQIPVRHFPRIAGKSKYHLWNRLMGPFRDCFAYKWMKSRYINYIISDTNIQHCS